MTFPWEPAVPQALQQHGGRNWTAVRKAAAPQAPATPVVESPVLAPEDSVEENHDVPTLQPR